MLDQFSQQQLQNVQARARVPGIWLVANLRGAILLATSNRSEAAVGYATMDGDTAGGVSPLAGIDKAFLRTWLRWMEQEGPAGLHPFACLAPVNALAPTAELRHRLVDIDADLVEAHEFVSLPDLVRTSRVVISHAGAPMERSTTSDGSIIR